MRRVLPLHATLPPPLGPWLALALVVEHNSLAGAARELGLHRSALTRQMQALEKELGLILLRRDRQGSQLTAAGQRALPHAQALLTQARAALARAADQARWPAGQLTLWAPGSWLRSRLMPRLPGFFAQHPGLWLDLHSDPALRQRPELHLVLDWQPQGPRRLLWEAPWQLQPLSAAPNAVAATNLEALLGLHHVLPATPPGTESLRLTCAGEIGSRPFQPARCTWLDDTELALALARHPGVVAWLPTLLAPLDAPNMRPLPGGWRLEAGAEPHPCWRLSIRHDAAVPQALLSLLQEALA
jgi:DNA-binding transcriptional LysR family regulator